MNNLNSVLAATDFSPAADAALRQAARLARKTGAALHVMHAPASGILNELAAFFPETGEYGTAQAMDALRERVAAQLASCDAPKDTQIHIRAGNPFKAIRAIIDETNADLLVIGSIGQTSQKLGSVGGKCVRAAPINTLLVPPGGAEPYRHITACVDFSELSPDVVATAASIAKLEEGSVTALYAHEKVDDSIFVEAAPRELVEKLPGVIESRFNDQLAPHAGDVDVTFTMITARNYSDGIVDHAANSGTDLVVTGTTGRSGLAYMLLGTTAEKVIRKTGSAVLAVKPKQS